MVPQLRNASFSLSHPSNMQSEIPTPSKVVAYLLASCTPEQRTGLPPTCTSSWLQRHKPVCALWFVLKSAFWFMFYHHCQLFQVFSFVLAHQSRHHEDQMQMCQMKSSSKRSRVKTCSVSISCPFHGPLTATLVTTQQSCSNLCGLNTVQIIVFLPVLGT